MIGKTNAITIIGGGDVDPTLDNKTHLFIRLTTVSGLSPSIHITKTDTSTLTIDWGDGSTQTNSASGVVSLGAHTYSTIGDYEITMWISSGSGTYSYGMGYVGSYFFGGYSNVYSKCLLKVYVGNNVTAINEAAFYLNFSLEKIYLGSSITTIAQNSFNYCYSLQEIVVLGSLTTLNLATFANCFSLKYAYFPNSLTSIAENLFALCHSLKVYKFYSTTAPTLANTNAFSNINTICKIYVPDASVAAYKAATNWSTYANYIYPLSDIE